MLSVINSMANPTTQLDWFILLIAAVLGAIWGTERWPGKIAWGVVAFLCVAKLLQIL